MEQRGDELNLLLHALGKLLGFHCESVGGFHASGPVDGAFAGGFGTEAMELAEEDKLIEDLHLFVEAALLGQIADAVEVAAREGRTEEINAAGVGQGDAHHHADGAGFAGAVGAEETEHLAGLDGEREVADGDFALVGLGDSRELNNRHGGSRCSDGGLDAWQKEKRR